MIPGDLEMEAVDGEFVVLGENAEDRAGPLLTGAVRDRLLAPERGSVAIGNPADVLVDQLAGEMGGVAGLIAGSIRERLEEHPGFDPATVSHSSEGLPVGAGELRRRAEAVVAVANAVETGEIE